jgi:hypothetical protein
MSAMSAMTCDSGDAPIPISVISGNQWYVSQVLMEKKIFWMLFLILGTIMDVALPIWWSLALTLPLLVMCWWIAYKSGWFD